MNDCICLCELLLYTSIKSTNLQELNIYHFNELEIGLAYLPGSGVVLNAYANGMLMNRNYALTAKEIEHEIDCVTDDDLDIFPRKPSAAATS